MYNIFLTSTAVRDLNKIQRNIQKKIAHTLEVRLKPDPFSQSLDIKKLQEPLEGYRLRIGEYRVLYDVDEEMITVYRVRHRKDAYK